LHQEPPLSRANSCSNSPKPELTEAPKDSSINFAEAFKTHRVMFAIEKSLAEGRPVRMEEMERW